MKIIQLITLIIGCTLVSASCATKLDPVLSKASMLKKTKEVIPFDSNRWVLTGDTRIEEYLGEKALNLGIKAQGKPFGSGSAVLKGIEFENGIIEYDIVFDETRTFAGLQFHMQPGKNHEEFYMRAHQSGNPDANQYMPIYNGVPSWQLYYGKQYSAPIKYVFNQWMHVKIVVSGKLADIYIRDMQEPALTVRLKRPEMTGKIGLWGLNIGGDARFSNFTIQPMDHPEIKGTPEPEKVAKHGSILSWSVSDAFDEKLILGKYLLTEDDIANVDFWTLKSEASGLTNLAQIQGVKPGKDTVFAKIDISSESDQLKKLEFGFSDKVKVYLNKKIIFEANDKYESRDYRFLGTIGFYDAIYLPLKKGNNELLLAITENVKFVGGWAIQARFENMKGIALTKYH